MTEEARAAFDRHLDDVLGPPTFRERLIDETMAALRSYDYPDSEDEVDYAHRRAEACHVLAYIGGDLIAYGREQAGRACMPEENVRVWDMLAGLLRFRDGWRVAFADGQPWWVYRAPEGASIDDHLTIAVGHYSDPGGPSYPFLVSTPPPDDNAFGHNVETLRRMLPEFEAEAVARAERP